MHDLIYENQARLGDDELLPELAQQLHLAPAKLIDALESKEFETRVKADFSSGVRSGVTGPQPSSSTVKGTTARTTSLLWWKP